MLSLYSQTKSLMTHYDFAERTFDNSFEYFIDEKIDFGDYFCYVVTWYFYKNNKSVMF
ncbi:MAG: hypothetical protein JJP05_00335 [cyanobacterium endosymbiont of Rhopalodia gibba]